MVRGSNSPPSNNNSAIQGSSWMVIVFKIPYFYCNNSFCRSKNNTAKTATINAALNIFGLLYVYTIFPGV